MMSLEEINVISNMIIAIFAILGTIISGFILFILIWEHINKYIKLRKNVQKFYENIEKLIFSYYEFDYYNTLFHRKTKFEGGLRVYDKESIEAENISKNYHFENEFYKKLVKNEFDDYKKYLGMVFSNVFYLNRLDVKISERGTLNYQNNYIDNLDSISIEKINLINKFLKGLRDYWNKNYSVFLLRCKIKEKENFKRLTGYLNKNKKDA